MKRDRVLWVASGVAAATALLTRWQLARWFSDQPGYEVEKRVDGVEIRRYERSVRVETTVRAESWDEALNEGFHRLAAYILGANHPRQLAALGQAEVQPSSHSRSLSSRGNGERIHMAAPVTARLESGENDASGPQNYIVSFAIPKRRAERPLPVPEDKRVHLRSVPARRIAVLRYAGRPTFERASEKSHELRAALERAGLQTRGEPEFAGYDPPSTLPLLRRNEIWVELGAKRLPEVRLHA